jgi:hypothetical protein
MAVKTYEILIRGRGISAGAADPADPATASAATFTLEGVTVNGTDKPVSFFQGSELSTLTAAVKAGIVDALDVATVGAAVVTKDRSTAAGIGDFSVTDVAVAPGAKAAEVWTVTVTNAALPRATWSVVGSTLGAAATAYSGLPYNNGSVSFTINDLYTDGVTEKHPGVADQFTLTVGAAV